MKTALNPNTIQTTSLKEQMEVCVATGYEGFELMHDAIANYLNSGHDLLDIKKNLVEKGVAVAAIYAGNPFWSPGNAIEQSLTMARFRTCCAYCLQMGCEIITMNSMDEIPNEIGTQQLRVLCHEAQSYGVKIAYEFLGFARQFSDIRSSLSLLDRVRELNFGLVVDCFHLYRGGSTLDEIDLIPKGKIYLAHINDVINKPLDQTTDLDRVFPGDGILDNVLFLQKLRSQDYDGFVSVEIFNNDYWKKDPFWVAREAKNRLDGLLGRREKT